MYNDELRIRKFVRALKLRSSLNIDMFFKFQYVFFSTVTKLIYAIDCS